MNNSITYRKAELSDLDFIVNVYNQTIASRMVTADLSPVTVADRLAWFNSHNSDARPIWLVFCNNQPCGWASLSSFYGRPAYDQTVEISIYIHEDFRGKKIGSILASKLEKYAKEQNIKTILSFVFGHNLPSIKMFEKLGYQTWGNLPSVANLDGVERDLFILGKRIS